MPITSGDRESTEVKRVTKVLEERGFFFITLKDLIVFKLFVVNRFLISGCDTEEGGELPLFAVYKRLTSSSSDVNGGYTIH
jgi:hypothetical protein